MDDARRVISFETSKRRFYDLFNVWEGLGIIKKMHKKQGQYKWVGLDSARDNMRNICRKNWLNFNVPNRGFRSLTQMAHHIGLWCCAYPTTATNECKVTAKFLRNKFKNNRRVYDVICVMEGTGLLKSDRKKRKYKQELVWLDKDGTTLEKKIIFKLGGVNVFE